MKNLALIFVFMLAFKLASVDAIKCYTCTDATSNCATNPTDGCGSCYIIKTSGSINGVSANYVSKTCMPTSVGSGCASQSVNGLTGTACYCSTDLCDAGSLVGYTYSLVLAMAALLFAFY